MLKFIFLFITGVHGLIHLMGFVKGFELAKVDQLTQPISRLSGIIWLATCGLFLITLGLLLFQFDYWWVGGLVAVALSQFVIIQSWDDAKFGTIANVIVLVPVILALINSLPSSFQNMYKSEAQQRLAQVADAPPVTEKDLEHLPEPVQKYVRYSGAVGKPRIYNFRVISSGSMKQNPDSNWIEIKAQQYDFVSPAARLFYINSALFGIPFDGLHKYVGNSASMEIKIASLVQVADARGEKMNQSENVTLLNDMCALAPATLIEKNLRWEALDALSARVYFTNNNITVSGTLYFNEKGELVDFSSDDRFLSSDGKSYTPYRWTTPLREYRDFNGRKLATEGDAIWHRPEGEYVYARYKLESIEYNVREFAYAK
jgi:hypothetical protein